jgi:uncharacterized protein YjiS (DUF1127 family)
MNAHTLHHLRSPSAMRFANAVLQYAAAARALAGNVAQWFAARKRAAQDLDALAAMSERELHDIGINRASIGAVAARVAKEVDGKFVSAFIRAGKR